MAHTLYSPEQAARATLASLRWLTNLPRTVRQDFSSEFVAGRGQTVNVRGPISAGKANVYTKAQRDAREAIKFNELNQTWFPVKLENQIYNALRLPDDFATFTLTVPRTAPPPAPSLLRAHRLSPTSRSPRRSRTTRSGPWRRQRLQRAQGAVQRRLSPQSRRSPSPSHR